MDLSQVLAPRCAVRRRPQRRQGQALRFSSALPVLFLFLQRVTSPRRIFFEAFFVNGRPPVPRRSVVRGNALPAGELRFLEERAKGLYSPPDAHGAERWHPWDDGEGSSARSPRIGKVDKPWTGGVTFMEVCEFLNSQAARDAVRADAGGVSSVAGRLMELGAAATLNAVPLIGPASWSSSDHHRFQMNEESLSAAELSALVSAPNGWELNKSSAWCLGYVVTVGCGSRATSVGLDPILQNIHRDWRDDYLVDICLVGCVGRKRIIFFAPDELEPNTAAPWIPNLDSPRLQDLQKLPDEEVWAGLEALALRSDISGGFVDLGPGEFIFMPHGWWHAVRPIDPFTVITGPAQLSAPYY